jgi:two-component system sensor histidine kinase/response regulator
MRPYGQRKSLQELLSLKPGLYGPELSESPQISEAALRNELRTLRRSNERLREESAALRVRNEELDAYAHTVAHNLKNPLAVIIVTADAISDIPDLTHAERKEFMHQIRSTAYDMNSTIDSLLLLSEVRKVDAPVEPVDMARVVENVRNRMSTMVKDYQGWIISPETWPAAIGYAPWIEEVWANYISNAIQHGGRPPRVELGASTQPDGMIRFWTRDNGPGLLPETRAQLFAPFNQSGRVHKPGHGLGLSIVRRIIEKLGGQVGVESEAGRGSLFFFTLPAVRQPSLAESRTWEGPRLEPIQTGEEVQ